MHPKFAPYLDSFTRGSVTNSLRCFIAERDPEIIYREAIARAARKENHRKGYAERTGDYYLRCMS